MRRPAQGQYHPMHCKTMIQLTCTDRPYKANQLGRQNVYTVCMLNATTCTRQSTVCCSTAREDHGVPTSSSHSSALRLRMDDWLVEDEAERDACMSVTAGNVL